MRKRVTKDSSTSRGKQTAAAPPEAREKTRVLKPAAKASPQQAVEVKRGKSQPARRAADRQPRGASAKSARPAVRLRRRSRRGA